jgi:hypothetical protein
MSATSLAEQYFEAQLQEAALESALDSAVVAAFGADPVKPSEWPFTDMWYDDYDGSFEVAGCDPAWEPTREQLQAVMALGFMRGWINYTDGSERVVSRNGALSARSHTSRVRGRGFKRLVRLVAQL